MPDFRDLRKTILTEIERRVASPQLRAGMDLSELLKAYALIERAQGGTEGHKFGSMGDLELLSWLKQRTGKSVGEIATWLGPAEAPKTPAIDE